MIVEGGQQDEKMSQSTAAAFLALISVPCENLSFSYMLMYWLTSSFTCLLMCVDSWRRAMRR